MSHIISLSLLLLALWLFSGSRPLSAANSTTMIGEGAANLQSIAFDHYTSQDINLALDFYEKAVDRAIIDYGINSTYLGDLYFEMGLVALESGKFGKAEVYLRQAVKHNPNSAMARIKLAELLRLREKPDLALELIRFSITKHPSSPLLTFALLSWLRSYGHPGQAIQQSYVLSQILRPKPSASKEKLSSLIRQKLPPAHPLVHSLNSLPESSEQAVVRNKSDGGTQAIPKSIIALVKAGQSKSQTIVSKKDHKQVVDVKLTLRNSSQKNSQNNSKNSPKARRLNKSMSGQRGEKAPKKLTPVVSTIKDLPTHTKTAKPRASLVPPPPPTVPYFGPAPVVSIPAQLAPKQEPKSKTREKPKEKPKEAEEKHPSVVSPNEGDPEFILEWSGVNARKKH